MIIEDDEGNEVSIRNGRVRVNGMDEAQLHELQDDLKKLDGVGPYNEPSNPCINDAHFAKSLEKKYGMPLRDLRKVVSRG